MSTLIKSQHEHTHILVVDDEKLIREMLHKTIKRAGYDCSIAEDAEDALKILEKKNVDVVITDIKMPGINGIELTNIIREKYDSDVIVMTGFANDLTYENIIEKVDHKYLNKDVDFMDDIIPTAENLVIQFWKILKEVLLENNTELYELKLYETENNIVVYRGE